MLEIKNLTKVYKNKVGTDVLALDDISLSFPETGMVFLLGKSGSGKSTLLNVCGGLDNPTKGEIIVKGRSSKDFNQADFDSYRNTFVGFIFQEYNILNEFSVYDNIALAIELQDKTPDKNTIEELLKKVDLEGYGKRKPNTLSGGQKQRIAIARALVKNPEIIMADEPTGALDSNTGRQVLETLKKLSEDTLVIVVSHDREFAETYGDRIIELKDGKVISDITKTTEVSEVISSNVFLIGDTLSIKSGSELTDSDFNSIKEFIKNTSNDVILSKNDKDISALKKSARINDSGEQEVFRNTNYENIELKEYTTEDGKFIKSKLPMRHAFKIGISSMKNKPFRLFMTVVLVSIAFMLFGLLSTLTFYSSENTFKDTLLKSDYKYLKLSKEYKVKSVAYSNNEKNYEYENFYPTPLNTNDFNELKKKYGNDVFYAIDAYLSFSAQKGFSRYYKNDINNVGYLDENHSIRKSIIGEYPKKDDEIVLSTYTVDAMINNIAYDINNNAVTITKREDIIGKTFKFGQHIFKVVGIFDSGDINPKYDSIKETADSMLESDYEYYLMDELHSLAFVSENKMAQLSNEYSTYFESDSYYTGILTKYYGRDDFAEYPEANYKPYKDSMSKDIIMISSDKKLGDNNVYISIEGYADMVLAAYEAKCMEDYNLCNAKVTDIAYNLKNGGKMLESGLIAYSKEEELAELKKLMNMVKLDNLEIEFKFFDEMDQTSFGDINKVNVIGVYSGINNDYRASIYYEQSAYDKVWDEHKKNLSHYTLNYTKFELESTPYRVIYVPYDGKEESIDEFYKMYSNKKYGEDDSRLILSSSIVENVRTIDDLVNILYKVFLYGGIVLCVFSMLLFSNFISVSISYKTREIGILRAVGARSIDVFKIFFSESFVITLMCLAISITASITVCNILNEILSYGVGVSVFVFGIFSLIVLLMLGLLTSFLSTYLPVLKAAKKKPVDSIRSI